MSAETSEVTVLLRRWKDGDHAALESLFPLVYEELRRIASDRMRRERPDHVLESAALVNEAFIRLVDRKVDWQNRSHFFAVAAQAMRRILVEHARSRDRQKRGGDVQTIAIDEQMQISDKKSIEILALDDALNSLEQLDPEQSRLVEMRFFAGLTAEETAEALGVSPSTVQRNWITARAFLLRELKRAR